jgi:hypothetical protein
VKEGFHIGGHVAVYEILITYFEFNYRIATVFNFHFMPYFLHQALLKPYVKYIHIPLSHMIFS